MTQTTLIPLTDAQLQELDQFLLSNACDERTLLLDEAHGLITASVVAPEPLSDALLLEQIWGEPTFASRDEQHYFSALLLQMRDEVSARLASGAPFEPLVVDEEDEHGVVVEVYEGWCFGFVLGVEQQQQFWQDLAAEQQGLLAPMAQLALLVSDDEPEMDEEQYDAWVELIAGAVTGLYRYWHP